MNRLEAARARCDRDQEAEDLRRALQRDFAGEVASMRHAMRTAGPIPWPAYQPTRGHARAHRRRAARAVEGGNRR